MPRTLTFHTEYLYGREGEGISIPIYLRTGEQRIKLLAKIDTGATFCIFQRSRADALHLDLETGVRQIVRTANGEFETFGHEVTIECFEWQLTSMVYFASQQDVQRDVLGRAGWMNQFRMGIIEHDALLYLSQYDQ
jgi:predicted aspartyl protease